MNQTTNQKIESFVKQYSSIIPEEWLRKNVEVELGKFTSDLNQILNMIKIKNPLLDLSVLEQNMFELKIGYLYSLVKEIMPPCFHEGFEFKFNKMFQNVSNESHLILSTFFISLYPVSNDSTLLSGFFSCFYRGPMHSYLFKNKI